MRTYLNVSELSEHDRGRKRFTFIRISSPFFGSFSCYLYVCPFVALLKFSCYLYVCPFVALLKVYMPEMCTLFSPVQIKKRSYFNLSCVLICFVFLTLAIIGLGSTENQTSVLLELEPSGTRTAVPHQNYTYMYLST